MKSTQEIAALVNHYQRLAESIHDTVLNFLFRLRDTDEARHSEVHVDPVFDALYYNCSYPHQFATYERHFNAFVAKFPDVLTQHLGDLLTMRDLAADFVAAKAERKAARGTPPTRTCDGSTYKFPTTPSASCLAGNCHTREFLLVRYGIGTQLVYIQHANPDRKTMQVLRLQGRGTRYATWVTSKLSRFDARILGKSAPVLQDPKLPTVLKLSGNMVTLEVCPRCQNVHTEAQGDACE